MQLDLSKLDVGDWIVVKLRQEKAVKMNVGQLTEKESCLEANFSHRFGKTSSFYWPIVEDKSIIEKDEIYIHLPTPSITERDKIIFRVNFDSYNIGLICYIYFF
ncbi:unnamed protein product [Psylliodes chrysocephalus]|uniref:Uncharacterized protein n=1 Tax=Psylliodes chrysocephalus TaxID=3402493 RepID=A0A9P0DDI5_9CUCU|nr:unnamed protein product [Psylliodes chrysocephala]